ncbi:MAG TPA: DNA primase DnaG [Candidatus Dormibacteraeota bacterium]|nr:DNA primase DnaG [Candidatus Dormibacteraeota bacterium]
MVEPSQYASTTKYIVKARFDVEGVVEKPDVVGAVFGQTEGLFGPDLDLRELQKSGRIGRIEINLDSKKDKTTGSIVIPSSLDKVSTAIIAAAIESVDRIGPCEAKISLDKVEDVREEKRKAIMTKAKDILRKWVVESSPSTEEVVKEVAGSLRGVDVIEYGPEKLPAGPEVERGDIIVVEGRADVILLMKCGIKNVIALNGTKVPDTVIKLTKDREVTAFLDGDRAGDLILKELTQVADIDYVARATFGKEVEELTPKEVMRALRERVSVNMAKPIERQQFERPQFSRPERPERGYGERSYTERAYGGERPFEQPVRAAPQMEKPNLPNPVFDAAKDLRGTLEAVVFDEEGKELSKMPVSELAEKIPSLENARVVLFDGVVTQRLLDTAASKGIKYVIGDRVSDGAKKPANVSVMTLNDLSAFAPA